MLVAILGDTHFGARNDSQYFVEKTKQFYQNVFFPTLEKYSINQVIQLGDLFDRRKFINFNTIHQANEYFFDEFVKRNINLHILLGNHCIYYKNTLTVNSPELLLKDYDNITIYNDFKTISFDNTKIDIVPWICRENHDSILSAIEASESEICMGHFEIDGFQMDRGNVYHGEFKKTNLRKYSKVISGHFHHKSDDGQIFYVGTPYEMTWQDFNDERGFHIFDTETYELKFIQNPYKMFYKLVYNDEEQTSEFWQKNIGMSLDSSVSPETELANSYVNLLVVKKKNTNLFESVVSKLNSMNLADLNIIEDYNDKYQVDDESVDSTQDTVTLLKTYVQNMNLDVDTDKLQKLLTELYVEAFNSE